VCIFVCVCVCMCASEGRTAKPLMLGSMLAAGTSTSSMTIWPVTDARRENLPSILGVDSPFIPCKQRQRERGKGTETDREREREVRREADARRHVMWHTNRQCV
jgi:hypothetical protein